MTPDPHTPLECGGTTPLSTASLGSPHHPPGGPSCRPVQSGAAAPHSKDWPHAPVHRLGEIGTYMVTAGTLQKVHHLHTPAGLSLVRDALFSVAEEFNWRLQAWAILSNHYHFIAHSPTEAATLRRLVSKLHMTTAKALNQADGTPGRRVWFQYWDSRITFETSLWARLRYVHTNPVHHGVVKEAEAYAWCSAGWWAKHATVAAQQTLTGFKTDQLEIPDDF